ncbi:prolyl endopeptidase-like, partial [Cynoglossus semilaevis]|uniref:prolyl endopeptidase-like n=1 Tax=Cynoglossus semilaevis TaxID=244447 RepID=UPI000495998C
PNTADHSAVCGRHHVYFVDGDGIYRTDKSHKNPEQVLDLEQVSGADDENRAGSRDRKWSVQRIRLSPAEKHLAATLKANDRDEPRCVIVQLEGFKPSNVLLTLDAVFTFEWATDQVLFYTTAQGLRSSRVCRLDLSGCVHSITSVYEEQQPDVFVEVALSRDQEVLSINCSSRSSSQVMLLLQQQHRSRPHLVQERQPGLLYHVEHWRGHLIILANTGPGREYQVLQAPLSQPSMVSWVPVFTPDPGTVIKDMDIVGDHCVLTVRTNTNHLVLTVVPLMNQERVYTVKLPSWVCVVETRRAAVPEQTEVLELFIWSPVHSPHLLRLDPHLGLVSSGSEASPSTGDRYKTTSLEACSHDGSLVPVTLFHSASVEASRRTPLLLHVYGSYGLDLGMDFCPQKTLLLEGGWALAYCHIRGGAEKGLSWHRQARRGGKERGVQDLQACLQRLFSSGVSCPSLTAITAHSAGAVPVAALCNRQPHLMRAVSLQAPFLDVLGTMEDQSLPLTLEDRDEWGDPVANPKDRLSIASYCPRHNITPQCYPSMLLTAYSDDSRIPLAGVLKYSQQLKEAIDTHFSTNPQPEPGPEPNLVLNIKSGASHHGPDDFEQMLEEEALNLAFLHKELGLHPPRRRPRRSGF